MTDTTPNPLLTARLATGMTRKEYGAFLRTSATTVQFAEAGCFLSIPTPYHPILDPVSYQEYQLYRLEKRRENFNPSNFPMCCSTLSSLLEHLDLKPYQFAEKICIQPAEVWRLLTGRRTHLPANLLQAFMQIGVDHEYIANFNKPNSSCRIISVPEKSPISK